MSECDAEARRQNDPRWSTSWQQAKRHAVHGRDQRPGEAGVVPSECHFVIPAKAGIHDEGAAMEKAPFVYVMASKRNGTLYTGVTSDLVKRVWEHREGLGAGFTRRYGVKRLVYFEAHGDMYAAITREKQIKEWRRAWKWS